MGQVSAPVVLTGIGPVLALLDLYVKWILYVFFISFFVFGIYIPEKPERINAPAFAFVFLGMPVTVRLDSHPHRMAGAVETFDHHRPVTGKLRRGFADFVPPFL